MFERILPRYSFEQSLPDGWFLSRLYKGKRVLYYNDVKVASIADDFDIETNVKSLIANPPEAVQQALYQDGKVQATELSPAVQKKLIKKGIIPYEFALNCFHDLESWLHRYIPARAEYAGKSYTNRRNRWYDEEGNCINSSVLFFSIWDARVRYAQGKCTLSDVARYSWSAVLECLGDDHQRFINSVITPKLETNRKGWVLDAKDKRNQALEENSPWEHTEWDCTEEIDEEYRKDVNSTLYNHFFNSIDNQVMMFTQNCNIPAFKGVKERVENYEKKVLDELCSITPTLCRFKWNSLLRNHEPVFSPQRLNPDKKQDLEDLIHQVIIGTMSGHEAALHFVNGDWNKIRRESNRYEKHMTQHIPFYTDMWKMLSPEKLSFSEAVKYVKKNIIDLISMGYRSSDKVIASFDYDQCRFSVHIRTGEVKYLGVAKSKYMSDSWLAMKPEQRRKYLNDDVEWEYQEQAIKKYNRLFSYLYNVVHKHWDRACYYLRDKLAAKKKYLKPSPRFLSKMKAKAEEYIKSLERGVVTC